jgi:hypothetical protein
MTGRWTLALLLSILVLTPRAANAGGGGEPAPGRSAVSPAAPPVSRSVPGATAGAGTPVLPAATRNDSFCLTCHGDAALETRFADGAALSLHVDARVLRDSAHGQLDCVTCHTDSGTHPDPPMPSSGLADYQARAVQMCVRCHLAAAGEYAGSVHGTPVLSGSGGGATCNDCHSPDGSAHSTSRVASLSAAGNSASVAENCGRCHSGALATYQRTGHGQLVEFASNQRAATCTDCHGDHAVKAVADPSGGLTPSALAVTCQNCHRGADAKFAGQWLGHEASTSPTGLADFAHWGVVLVMAVGVCFGVTHVTLDFLRNPRRPGGSPK